MVSENMKTALAGLLCTLPLSLTKRPSDCVTANETDTNRQKALGDTCVYKSQVL